MINIIIIFTNPHFFYIKTREYNKIITVKIPAGIRPL